MAEKKQLVTTQKLDTVSPATRLLDKRRKMYENQEAYLAKKKHFTQQEFEFQTREAELREEDHKLQQSLIQYATFLDNNAKMMRNCDQNIQKLNAENKQRDSEIERKRNQFRILQAKRERIEQQKAAVEQYQSFLEDVKNQNQDDYSEVNEIRDRHKTLDTTKRNLIAKKTQITDMYESKRKEVLAFERSMDNKIMSLNNEIAKLTKQCDAVEAEKSSLQTNEEETSAKKWEQIAELSQVIFAIEMIENLCSKKTEYHTTILPYQNASQAQKSFDSFSQCETTSLKQLEHIGYYMKDFRAILESFKVTKPNAKASAAVNIEDSEEDD